VTSGGPRSSAAPRVALLDYGAGNLRSVGKALERSGFYVDVVSDPSAVANADGIVLPGVGAFADAMASLRKTGLGAAVIEAVGEGRPYLGLCFGLQLLFEEGEEHGIHPGLGLLPGRVERFAEKDANGKALLIPHIGWNKVTFRGDHPMIRRLPESDLFYFVHSYRAVPSDSSIIVGETEYGAKFASAVAKDSIFAVQFHPEKSQMAGKRVLDAYRAWVEELR
jgi:glutamine amidotransferase